MEPDWEDVSCCLFLVRSLGSPTSTTRHAAVLAFKDHWLGLAYFQQVVGNGHWFSGGHNGKGD